MCHFLSWIEYKGEILFLTEKELNSKKGMELKKYLGAQYDNDKIGHGAIEWFYDLPGNTGKHCECEDFSNPDNFPKQVVSAIKKGYFCELGICEAILTKKALAEYEKISGLALAEYQKINGQAWAEYQKINGPAWAEYQKINGPAWAEYEKINKQTWAEYEKISGPAWAEYQKIKGQAWAEYQKINGPAWAEYQKINGQAFWKIAKQSKNRIAIWR